MKGKIVDFDIDSDCIGLLCPLPVLRARKLLAGMQKGQVLKLRASDAMAAIDVPHFCADAGHELLAVQPYAQGAAYFIRHGGQS